MSKDHVCEWALQTWTSNFLYQSCVACSADSSRPPHTTWIYFADGMCDLAFYGKNKS